MTVHVVLALDRSRFGIGVLGRVAVSPAYCENMKHA